MHSYKSTIFLLLFCFHTSFIFCQTTITKDVELSLYQAYGLLSRKAGVKVYSNYAGDGSVTVRLQSRNEEFTKQCHRTKVLLKKNGLTLYEAKIKAQDAKSAVNIGSGKKHDYYNPRLTSNFCKIKPKSSADSNKRWFYTKNIRYLDMLVNPFLDYSRFYEARKKATVPATLTLTFEGALQARNIEYFVIPGLGRITPIELNIIDKELVFGTKVDYRVSVNKIFNDLFSLNNSITPNETTYDIFKKIDDMKFNTIVDGVSKKSKSDFTHYKLTVEDAYFSWETDNIKVIDLYINHTAYATDSRDNVANDVADILGRLPVITLKDVNAIVLSVFSNSGVAGIAKSIKRGIADGLTPLDELYGKYVVFIQINLIKPPFFISTLFHELVHTSIDVTYRNNHWESIIQQDNSAMDPYAETIKNGPCALADIPSSFNIACNYHTEDHAQTFFFYVASKNPTLWNAVPEKIQQKILRLMPNRFAEYDKMFTDEELDPWVPASTESSSVNLGTFTAKQEERTISDNSERSVLYSNPAADILNLRLAKSFTTAKVQILSTYGKLVYQRDVIKNNSPYALSIDIKELQSGAYIIKISSNDFVETHHFIKE